VIAVALSFIALAQPQYGRGTRLIPATNLDVVIVLDYSKSMYAKDITPSRILRAKSEVGRLIQDLPGARFGDEQLVRELVTFDASGRRAL
jgi:Ca-activated chloride channel homolog